MKHMPVIVAVVAGLAVGVVADRLAARTLFAPKPAPAAAAPVAAAPRPPRAGGQEDPRAVYKVSVEDSAVRGPRTALVTIVELSDFECPYCKAVQPTLRKIQETYGDKVRFAFKENPISAHHSALPAAKLAEAARAAGGDEKFWAVHDKLFALPAIDRPALEAVAHEIVGLSPAATKEALDSNTHLEQIRKDLSLAYSLGAHGTPSFFVNGRKLVGSQPFETFKALIDEELEKAEALVKSGVAPADVYASIIAKGASEVVMVYGDAPQAPQAAQAQAPQVVQVPIRADDPVLGPKVAPVTLVLFSDFQCPYCGKLEPTLKQLRQKYGDKVRLVWKHQPLPFHPNALPAARAAEAARQGGKFWEMHDKLFANQMALSDATYLQYAKELKLDPARFQRDATAEAAGKRIAEDQGLAAKVGAAGTPTLFVNCRRVVGAQPIETFQQLIDDELAHAGRLGEKVDGAFYDKICAANVAGKLAVAP